MPQLAQVPQYNFNFQNTNPEFQSIINSYHDYVNNVIEKDKENKSVFELAQNAIETMPIGNGSDGDKQLFLERSKYYGQKIHSLADASNGINGYANLTKQLDQLKHEVMTDDVMGALQQSFIHKNSLQQQVFGKEVTEVTNADGTKSRVDKDLYKGWTDDYRQLEFERSQKQSGVKIDQTTGKAYFQGGNFSLPEAITDINSYIRNSIPAIQEYEKANGSRWIGLDKGLAMFEEYGEKGKNWQGINDAVSLFLKTDPKYNAYIRKKVELENYDSETDTYKFSLEKQKQENIEDIKYQVDSKYGTNGKDIPNFYRDLENSKNRYNENGILVSSKYNGKTYSELEMFNKINDITFEDDTPDKKYNKILTSGLNLVNKSYEELENNYKLEHRIPLDQPLTPEQDNSLGKKLNIDKAIQRDISVVGNINKSIYGKNSDWNILHEVVDFEDREEKRKKRKEEDEKYTTSLQSGYFQPLDNINTLSKDDIQLNRESSNLKTELANKLNKFGYKNDIPIYDWISKNPNILKDNKDIKDIYTKSIQKDQEIETNNQQIKDFKDAIKNVDVTKSFALGIDTKTLQQIKDLPKEEFIKIKQQEEVQRIKKLQESGEYGRTTVPQMTANQIGDLYNRGLDKLVNIAKNNGITQYTSTGQIVMTNFNKDKRENYDNMVLNVLAGHASGTISGGNFKDIVTTNSKDWQKIMEKAKKTYANGKEIDGTFDLNRIIISPILSSDYKTKASITIDGKNYIVDVSGSDIGSQMKFESIKALKSEFDHNIEFMTPEEVNNKANIMWGQTGSLMMGTEIIKDNNQKDVPLSTQMPLVDLSAKVNNLYKDKDIQFISENGVKLKFIKVDGDGVYGGSIKIEAIDTRDGKWKNINSTNKTYSTFEDAISDLAQYVGLKGMNKGGSYMSTFTYLNSK
jgi:hypothetical protein